MKGFQIVRKWIDRSIKGLEMRAGDYPVKSTRYVGVIIVLAGLENVPRVKELDEIRTIYDDEQNKEYNMKEEEKIKKNPTIQIVNDETLFEEEMVMPIGIVNHPAMMKTENDIFEQDDSSKQANEDRIFQKKSHTMQYPTYPPNNASEKDETICDITQLGDNTFEDMFAAQSRLRHVQPSTPANDNDVFEDANERTISPSTHQQQYMHPPQYSPQHIQQPQTATIIDNPQFENQPVISTEESKSKETPKITISLSKKQRQINSNTIMTLKRQKKIDNVLAGMVNVGNRDKPNDSNNVFSKKKIVEGNNRPKNMMTDTCIKISGIQRPKETDGHIRMVNSQHPKEIDESAKIRDVQKPREVNKDIQVTTIPLPKNQTTREIAITKKNENDKRR
jgi:hypothetical protein